MSSIPESRRGPEGSRAAGLGLGGSAQLRCADSGECLATLLGHKGPVFSAPRMQSALSYTSDFSLTRARRGDPVSESAFIRTFANVLSGCSAVKGSSDSRRHLPNDLCHIVDVDSRGFASIREPCRHRKAPQSPGPQSEPGVPPALFPDTPEISTPGAPVQIRGRWPGACVRRLMCHRSTCQGLLRGAWMPSSHISRLVLLERPRVQKVACTNHSNRNVPVARVEFVTSPLATSTCLSSSTDVPVCVPLKMTYAG